jgi:hypothetical protein
MLTAVLGNSVYTSSRVLSSNPVQYLATPAPTSAALPRPERHHYYSRILILMPFPLSQKAIVLSAMVLGFSTLFLGETAPSTWTKPMCTPLSLKARLKLCTMFIWLAFTRLNESSCGTGSQGRWLLVTRRAGLEDLLDLARFWSLGT